MYYLFDLDGTIVSTDNIYLETFKTILNDNNLTLEWFQKNVQGKSDNVVFKHLFKEKKNDKQFIDFMSKEKDRVFVELIENIEIKLILGAVDFIQYLNYYNLKCSIITNCNRKACEAILKKIGIYELVDFFIIGNECNRPKPYPDPYLEAIKLYQTCPEQCIVFEDSPSGLLSAKTAGISCVIGIESTFSNEYLKKYSPDFTIKNFDLNLGNFIEKIYITQKINNQNILNIASRCKKTLNNQNIPVDYVIVNDVKLKGGFIANVYRLNLYYNKILKQYPKTVILKYENKSLHPFNKIANDLQLYQREYYFYETISRHVNIKFPKFYGLLKSKNLKEIDGVLLEDLDNDNLTLNPKLDYDGIFLVIRSTAKLHAQFWKSPLLDKFVDLKTQNDKLFQPSFGNFCRDKFPIFKNKWNKILSEEQIKLLGIIVAKFEKIQDKLSLSPYTLCHGDIKVPNMFMYHLKKEDQEPYFIDWQYIVKSKGVQDIVFFLIESFEIEKQIELEQKIIEKYYQYLVEFGVTNYSREELNYDWVIALCYFPVYVSIWFGSVPDDELIDVNFPKIFVPRVFHALTRFKVINIIKNL